jgi:predicted small lipoprotein YifL
MVAARLGGHPYFMQRFLQVDDDLAAVRKAEVYHAAGALVVNIGIRFIIDSVAGHLYCFEKRLCTIHEFLVGHYNFGMLKATQILVRHIALALVVLTLAACGQTGALYLPASNTSRSPAGNPPITPATPGDTNTPNTKP